MHVVAFVGFGNSTYTVLEGDGKAIVCIEVREPETINLLVAATIQTDEGSATGKETLSTVESDFHANVLTAQKAKTFLGQSSTLSPSLHLLMS